MSWGTPAYPYPAAYSSVTDGVAEAWAAALGGTPSFSSYSVVMQFGMTGVLSTPFALVGSSMSYTSGQSWPVGEGSIATMSSHLRKIYPEAGYDIAILFEYKVDDVATWWVTEDLPIQIWDLPWRQPPTPEGLV